MNKNDLVEVKCTFKVRGKPDRDVVAELPRHAAERLEGGEYGEDGETA
jgi:hypothetical protein